MLFLLIPSIPQLFEYSFLLILRINFLGKDSRWKDARNVLKKKLTYCQVGRKENGYLMRKMIHSAKNCVRCWKLIPKFSPLISILRTSTVVLTEHNAKNIQIASCMCSEGLHMHLGRYQRSYNFVQIWVSFFLGLRRS